MTARRFNTIETERLILRRFEAGDAEPFFKYRTLPEVALYQSEGWLTFTCEDAAQFVREQSQGDPGTPDGWFQIAIVLKVTGELIGDIGLHTLSDTRQAEIGFTIAPIHQQQGYAHEAVRALMGLLFTTPCFHRVIAIADVRNLSSVRLLEKLGMRREGIFLKSAWSNGAYADECQYALLSDEYAAAPG